VERKGSWYSKGETRMAQGRRPAVEFLRGNEAMTAEIEKEVRVILAEKKSPVKIAIEKEDGEGEGEEDEGAEE